MRILIVGAGAVGGYFGGRLAQAGRDVTLPRSSIPCETASSGWSSYHQPAWRRGRHSESNDRGGIEAPYDIVFLSVKAYALEAAINDFRPGRWSSDDDLSGAQRQCATLIF